jgi:hypothetical protein
MRAMIARRTLFAAIAIAAALLLLVLLWRAL